MTTETPSARSPNLAPSRSKPATAASWTIRVLLAAAFFAAGTAKLAGAPMMVHTFAELGFGQWFRYVTGVVEIAGAIGLFLPRLTGPAALGLGITMIAAILAHAFVLSASGIPAVVLAILAMTLAALHRDQITAFLTR